MKMKRRNKVMIIFGIILILAGLILVYWNISYSPFKKAFQKDMKNRLNATAENQELCTQEEIQKLPEALRKHCEYIGLTGSKKNNAVNVVFHNTKFVFDSKKGTILDMKYDLWLFYDKPFRSAFCKSGMFGVPFDGIDYSKDDKIGGMKGILGKAVEIFNVHNEQMYKASLISLLAEGAGLNPCILLSDYVTYEEIDSTHVKAAITYQKVKGTGIFTFDEDGRLTEFESDERQVEEINGKMTPIGWKAKYKDYKKSGSILLPGSIDVIKVYQDKEVVYFSSKDMEVFYYK
jgi:hypothetical protein